MKRTEQVLRWCNRIRAEYDIGAPLDELPKGERENFELCPIAKALNADVEADSIHINGTSWVDRLSPPKYVSQFIYAFDAGRHPELDLDRAENGD